MTSNTHLNNIPQDLRVAKPDTLEDVITFSVDSSDRLDKFLARMLPEHSRTKLAKMIEAGEVLVDGQVQKPRFTVEPGMVISLPEPEDAAAHDLTPANIPLDIVYEDEGLLVVNKPRGLAAHPATSLKEPSLVNALLARNIELSQTAGAFRPGIVHRLDKETTGLMVVAKTDQVHVALAKQMETKSAERRYFAVVGGLVERDRFVIDAPIARNQRNRLQMAVDPAGKHAVTHVKRVGLLPEGTVVACRLETGRTHQIRVHLSACGMPILGDQLYSPRNFSQGLMQLHAAFLAFEHPLKGERVSFFALPDESFYGHAITSKEIIDPFE